MSAGAADIFLIQPAAMSPNPETTAEHPLKISAEGAAWIKRVESMLSETGIESAQLVDTEPVHQTLPATRHWKDLPTTNHTTEQAPALAQQLKTTDLDTLVIADAEVLVDVLQTLGSKATDADIRSHQLIHLVRMHQGKVVDTLHWNTAGGAGLTDE